MAEEFLPWLGDRGCYLFIRRNHRHFIVDQANSCHTQEQTMGRSMRCRRKTFPERHLIHVQRMFSHHIFLVIFYKKNENHFHFLNFICKFVIDCRKSSSSQVEWHYSLRPFLGNEAHGNFGCRFRCSSTFQRSFVSHQRRSA